MSIIFFEGFDLLNTTTCPLGKIPDFAGSRTANSYVSPGRFGVGQYINATENDRFEDIEAFTYRPPGGVLTAFGLGFALNPSSLPASGTSTSLIKMRAGATAFFKVAVDSVGRFSVTDTTGTSSMSAPCVVAGNWGYFEFSATCNASTGSWAVKWNGETVLSGTGRNTGTAINSIGFQSLSLSTNCGFDDMYISDSADTIGEIRIDTLRPSADTATKNFTPNSGSNNFSRVNETTCDGDTSYNQTTTVGAKDLFDLNDLATTPSNVIGVKSVLIGEKDNVSVSGVRTNLVEGGTTTNGTERFLANGSYRYMADTLMLNPRTGAAWTYTQLNSTQLGYEVVE